MNTTNSLVSRENISSKTALIMLSVNIMVSFLVVASNLATILTFLINKHLRRHGVFCLIHLAMADMLYGVLGMLAEFCEYAFYFRPVWSPTRVVVNVIANLLDINIVTCLLSLVLVSLERVYAIYFPFLHRTSRARTYFVLFALTWLIPVSLLGPYLKETVTSSFGVILVNAILVLFIVSLITICISYAAVFMKVRKQAKRLQTNQQPPALRRARKREQHLGITLFIVTILSLLAWLPIITLSFFKVWRTIKISFFSYKIVRLVHLTNSLINPIVYVIRMRDFRKAMVLMLVRCSRELQRPYPVAQFDKYGGKNNPVIKLGIE